MRKEHGSMLERTEMVRYGMCGTSLREKKTSSELRDRTGKEPIGSVQEAEKDQDGIG